MITEDYVSFEIAKLLKEKGFDSEEVGCHGGFYSERCYYSGYGIITDSGQEVGIVYDDLRNADLEYDEYLRPTLQMARRWLVAVHNLFITFELDFSDGAYPMFDAVVYNLATCEKYPIINYDRYSYIKGTEAAIKYCLENLI